MAWLSIKAGNLPVVCLRIVNSSLDPAAAPQTSNSPFRHPRVPANCRLHIVTARLKVEPTLHEKTRPDRDAPREALPSLGQQPATTRLSSAAQSPQIPDPALSVGAPNLQPFYIIKPPPQQQGPELFNLPAVPGVHTPSLPLPLRSQLPAFADQSPLYSPIHRILSATSLVANGRGKQPRRHYPTSAIGIAV